MLTTVDARYKFKVLKLPEGIAQKNTITGDHLNFRNFRAPWAFNSVMKGLKHIVTTCAIFSGEKDPSFLKNTIQNFPLSYGLSWIKHFWSRKYGLYSHSSLQFISHKNHSSNTCYVTEWQCGHLVMIFNFCADYKIILDETYEGLLPKLLTTIDQALSCPCV